MEDFGVMSFVTQSQPAASTPHGNNRAFFYEAITLPLPRNYANDLIALVAESLPAAANTSKLPSSYSTVKRRFLAKASSVITQNPSWETRFRENLESCRVSGDSARRP